MLSLPTRNPATDKKHSRSTSDLSDPSTPRNFEDFRKNALLYTHVIAFTLFELETITKSFRSDYILGEGGFGTVYKGYIDENVRVGLKSLPVAVKVLNKEGLQGHREWLVSFALLLCLVWAPYCLLFDALPFRSFIVSACVVNITKLFCWILNSLFQTEVNFLGQLRHPNLVKLIGYCCEDDHRLLVYEFMFRGSLENHLFRSMFCFSPKNALLLLLLIDYIHGMVVFEIWLVPLAKMQRSNM